MSSINFDYTLDKDDMYHKIIHLPEQILKAYNEVTFHNKDCKSGEINRIVICGMGGSAISADIAKTALINKIPVEVVKDYYPGYIDSKTLFIAISYSGNTEETVSCLKEAMKKTDNIAAITSGGLVKDIVCDKYTWIELIPGYPPRSAIGFLFFSLVRLLEHFSIMDDQAETVKLTVANLIAKAGAVAQVVEDERNLAKTSAAKIHGKVPLVYASNPTYNALAYRWKCQINENAKYPAFHHSFSEMNHNEIEAWENQNMNKLFIPIFLSEFKLEKQYKNRTQAVKKIFEDNSVEYLEFFVEGSSFIEKFFSLCYLGDIISFYLALLDKADPTAIEFIYRLKKEITA